MIDLKNIERSYKTGHTETWVLRRVGLTINQGEFVTIMGPSGAGKSSLLNVLALLDDGWTGEYWFGEAAAHKLNRKQRAELARERIGMVFQSYHLLDDLTVAENIDLPLSYKNLPAKDRAGMVAMGVRQHDPLDVVHVEAELSDVRLDHRRVFRQRRIDQHMALWRGDQDRAQAMAAHVPGVAVDPLRRLGLHAYQLEFRHPFSGEVLRFETPVPQGFTSLFGKGTNI